MEEQEFAGLRKTRIQLGVTLILSMCCSVPLLAFGLWLSWGDAAATFIGVLCTFYATYHFIDGIRFYRWLKYEESRLRSACEKSKQEG